MCVAVLSRKLFLYKSYYIIDLTLSLPLSIQEF